MGLGPVRRSPQAVIQSFLPHVKLSPAAAARLIHLPSEAFQTFHRFVELHRPAPQHIESLPPAEHLQFFPWRLISLGPCGQDVTVCLNRLFPAPAPQWAEYMKVYGRLGESFEYRKMQNAVRQALDPRPREIIVDVGCGLFYTLFPLAQRGEFTLRGVDSTGEALVMADRQLRDAGIADVQLEWMDSMEYLTLLRPGSVNKIVAVNVMYVMNAAYDAVLEMRRVLAPGGRLVIADILPTFKPEEILWANLRGRLRSPWTAGYHIPRDLFHGLRILRHNSPLVERARSHGRTIDDFQKDLTMLGFEIREAREIYAGQAGLYVADKPVENQ